jgi:hypothetical protein
MPTDLVRANAKLSLVRLDVAQTLTGQLLWGVIYNA